MPIDFTKLPPPPVGADKDAYVWIDWYTKLQNLLNANTTNIETVETDLVALEDVVEGLSGGGSGIPIGSSLPGTGNEGDIFYNSTDGKLYRYHSGAWTAAVPTVDLVGTITQAQIADAAINVAKFASGIEPVTIVSSVPGALGTQAIFNTSDGKLYRWNGSAYIATVPGTDITANSITAGQIASGAISTDELAANAVNADKIAADAITSDKILANAITAGKIATDAVTSDKIAANAITSDKILANAITAGKILAGEIGVTKLAADLLSTDNVLTRSITIRDPSTGAVIFQSGGTLNYDKLSSVPENVTNATSDLSTMVLSANMQRTGNNFKRISGADAWDGSAHTSMAYTGGAYVEWAHTAGHGGAGLDAAPSAGMSWDAVDYWLHPSTNNGALYAYVGGSNIYAGTVAQGDVLAVKYDGSKVQFIKNGTVLYETTAAANLKLHGVVTLYYLNAELRGFKYGPYGNPSAVQSSNPITSSNVSTYIASAAIGWAQIGDLVINTGGGVRSGKTTYGSGTGWLLEYNSGTPRFDIGNSTKYLRWTGSDLQIGGDIVATGNIQAGAVTAITSGSLGSFYSITNNSENTFLTLSAINTTDGGIAKPTVVQLGIDLDFLIAASQGCTFTFRVKLAGTTVRTIVHDNEVGTGVRRKTIVDSFQVTPPTGDFVPTITVQCSVTPNVANEFDITATSLTVTGFKR